jgi:hypothetical protein
LSASAFKDLGTPRNYPRIFENHGKITEICLFDVSEIVKARKSGT